MHKSHPFNVHLILAIAGITGIAGLFLPFAYDVSPMKALLAQYFEIWRFAAPAFLSVFITLASARWIISGFFTTAEKIIAYVLGASSAVVTLSIFINGDGWPSGIMDWIVFAIPIGILLAGALLLLVRSGIREFRATTPLIVIQVPYLANCLFCLATFRGDKNSFFAGGWQIGAWFCMAACLVYVVQIVLFFTQKNETTNKVQVSVS